MASKLGFILSLIFVAQVLVLFGDLIAVQNIYTALDAVSVTAGYIISGKRGITDEVRQLVENETGGEITAITTGPVYFGSVYEYQVSKSFNPYIIKQEPMIITIKRSVIIGFYNIK